MAHDVQLDLVLIGHDPIYGGTHLPEQDAKAEDVGRGGELLLQH
jgi:hypothetical protein